MKICLIHEEFPEETNFGGIATYQKLISEYLKQLDHEVTIITRSLIKNHEYYENGIRVIRILWEKDKNKIKDYKLYRKKVAKKIKELVKNNEIDVIETPDWGAETIEYFDKRKVPIIVKLHTPLCIWQIYNKSGLGKKLNEHMLKWEKHIIMNADKVISCSHILLEKLEKQYLDLDYSKIRVIPNPYNKKEFQRNYNHNSNIILYVGSLEQRKGVDILAKAIPEFLKQCDNNIIFKFIGKDTNRNDKNISMINYIKDIVPKEYHKNLEFIGHVKNSELEKYYDEAKIGVIPSTFDNLPYVAQEMLMTGLPIVASDNTGVKEMIEDNKSGILFKNLDFQDLSNKLIDLYNNDKKRDLIGKNAREHIIKIHDPIKIAQAMEKIYKEAIYEFNNSSKD